jgi:hypothetical protein
MDSVHRKAKSDGAACDAGCDDSDGEDQRLETKTHHEERACLVSLPIGSETVLMPTDVDIALARVIGHLSIAEGQIQKSAKRINADEVVIELHILVKTPMPIDESLRKQKIVGGVIPVTIKEEDDAIIREILKAETEKIPESAGGASEVKKSDS